MHWYHIRGQVTFKISYNGQEESIRLIGIDTPESRRNSKAKKDSTRNKQDLETIVALGKEAAAFVKTLVKEVDKIQVEFDAEWQEYYGRL